MRPVRRRSPRAPRPSPPVLAGEERAAVAAGARRRPWWLAINLARLVLVGSAISWLRHLRLLAPAVGSIALLLWLCGLLSVSGVAVDRLLGEEASQVALLHVYLAQGTTDAQARDLERALARQPHVRSVRYVGPQQALARARQRPGLAQLAAATGTNPFPASLDVQVDAPAHLAAVARVAAAQPGVDRQHPTSYDPLVYQRLRRVALVAGAIAGGFALLLAAIVYVVSANAIRTAILARRDELLTMQLVGASPWLIRARLGSEGALTGGVAGLLAALALGGVCVAAFAGQDQVFARILPGVGVRSVGEVAAALVLAGVAMGAVAALFASRRLRP
ncbi:MAG TPA: permease-like cell division protein FtsX [Candidatus Dormibacteraeota bacterium]|nr:permease-like cell division protein FtsX [Candidatus Dormibacteraeota bacterium]